MKTAPQTLIAFLIDYFNAKQVIDWAIKGFSQHPIDESYILIEIISTNINNENELEKVGSLLKQYIEYYHPDFQLNDKSSEEYAKKLFYEQLQAYLTGNKLLPCDIYNMVSSIEVLYDYPSWLGDMYHACDWVEVTSTRQEFPQIIIEIEKTLASVEKID